MGLAVNIGAGCLQLQAFCDCSVFRFWHRLRRRGTAPGSAPKRRSGGPSSEEQDVQKLKLPVLFFSGEEVATLEVSLDWTGRRVKQALRPFLGKGHTVATVIHEGGVLLDSESLERIHLANDAHLYVTLRQCTFLVEGAGAEAVNGFYLRRRGSDLCNAPVYVNEHGTLLFKYRMARGTAYWYFSREGDLSRSDGDFYRVKSDAPKPPLEDWTCEACPLGRRTQVPSLTFCGEEDEESTDAGTSDGGDGARSES